MGRKSIFLKALIATLICVILCASLIYVPQAFAKTKPRVVPPSADPIDKKDAKYPKERIKLPTENNNASEKYLEKNGLYKVIIKGPKYSKINPNSVTAKIPTEYLSVVDNICLQNAGGTVTTWVYPDDTSKLENYTGTPSVASNFYVKYDIGELREGLVIHKAELKFDDLLTECTSEDIQADVFDAGTSWSSSSMTWSTQPTGFSLGQVTFVPSMPSPQLPITDKFKYYYYGHYQHIGIGFTVITDQATDCEVDGTYPDLEILYSFQEGGSPSGNDFSFGNGAGAMGVNSHSGSTVLSQYDIGFGIEGGMSLSFIRTYNSNSVVNYGMGPGWTSNYHQSLTVDANLEVATLRSGDGSYRCFIYDSVNSIWIAPDYTRLTLDTESLNNVTYYVVSDKYGNKLYFEYANGDGGYLQIIKNTAGGQINLTWSSGKLTYATDNISSRDLAFTYDTYGRMTDVSDPQSFEVSYTYDSSNQLVTRTDQDGEYIDYAYDSNGYLYQLTNENDKTGVYPHV